MVFTTEYTRLIFQMKTLDLNAFYSYSLLITYVGTENEFEWKGYLYVGMMFSVSLLGTIILQHYWHRCYTVGMRVRTALTSALYRKVRKQYKYAELVWTLVSHP